MSYLLFLVFFCGVLVIVLAGLYFTSFYSSLLGAPFVPIEKKYLREILSLGEIKENDIFCDFGCGDGRVLIEAVKNFNVKRAFGFEISPFPYLLSKWNVKRNKYQDKISVQRQNFFDISPEFLSKIDVLYIYLFPEVVDKLEKKVFPYLKKGTKIIAPSFYLKKDNKDFNIVNVKKIGWHTVYVYEKVR